MAGSNASRPAAVPLAEAAGGSRQAQRTRGAAEATAQILEALAAQTRAIEANTRAIAEILARLPERKATEQEKFARLVAALDDYRDEFTATELLDSATLPGREKMRAAILAVIGSSPEGGVRRFARFLARRAGESAGNLRLERIGRSGQGTRYRVLQVLHSNILPRRNVRGIRAKMKGKTP